MKLNINQIILYFLGVGFAGLAIYFQQQQEVWLASIGLFFTVILVVLAAFDPSSVMNLVIKGPGGHSSIELTRYTPPPQEFEEVLALGNSDTDTSIADDPLVEAAQERRPDEKAATDYLLLATNAWKEERYDEGFQYAYQGLALNPVRRIKASLESRLGILFYEINVIDMAEKCYRQAIESDPKFFGSHNNLGLLLVDQERPKEAEAAYRKAIDLDPDNALAYYNLGNLLSEQGQPEEAEEAIRQAIETDPKFSWSHNSLGALLAKQGRPEEAEAAYKRAIDLDPDNAAAHNNLGILLADQGRPKEAEVLYRKALDLDPDDADFHNNLGNLLKKVGRAEEAEQHFARAKEPKK